MKGRASRRFQPGESPRPIVGLYPVIVKTLRRFVASSNMHGMGSGWEKLKQGTVAMAVVFKTSRELLCHLMITGILKFMS